MRFTSASARSLLGAAWLLAAAARAQVATQPATQPAAAAAEPPAAAPFQRRAPVLDFRDFSFDLGLEGSYDRRRVEYERVGWARPGYRQTNRAHGFEETLGLQTSGALFDEAISRFDAAGRWGLSQEWFSESLPGRDRSESPHGDVLEYDLSFTLLPRGTVSAAAYATRSDSRVPRAFLPGLDRALERYGADVLVSHRTFPMRFSYEHVRDELTSRTRALRDEEQRGHDAFRYEGTWQASERHALRLEYEYEDRGERYAGGTTRFDTMRNYVVLNHNLRFGDEGRSALETLGRFQDESGDLARDVAELATLLRLQHTDALATNYRAQFLRESFHELTTRTWRGEAGLTHQLGQTLTSSLQLYGLRQNADANADFAEWGGAAGAAFSRQNRCGRFSANLSYNHAATDTRAGTRRGIVIGESLTLRDPLLSFLTHTDVDVASLVVTDAERTRTYLALRDYVVVRLGRYTALRRVASGRIADRQTVLVSYTYRVAADYDISRDRLDFRVQQDFESRDRQGAGLGGLTPYYAASLQDEDIDASRFLRFAARHVNRHRVGATWRRQRWSTGLEYEYNDETIDPYQALHANGDLLLWHSARQQLDGKTTLSRFWFDGTRDLAARNATLLDLGLAYRCLLTRDFEASASALYRYEDDSLYGITRGVDLTAALEWKLGYFSLRFEAEYDVLDLPRSGDDAFAVWLKLRREIPVIGRERS